LARLGVTDLRARYGKALALQGVSLELGGDEIVAVVGPNGAGKSTLLRAISGVLPCEGEITLDGQPLRGLAPHEIIARGVVHCPERRQLFGDFSVLDNLRLGAYLRRDRAAIEADLERVLTLFPRLRERVRQTARTLSGGEQQMVAIGRSLMSRPRVLLLDEPSLGLAPLVKDTLIESIAQVWRDGVAVLLVEQDISLALELAQRAYILEHGAVVLAGSSAELADNPRIRDIYFQLA
jgi:branched-chain amino acid transport system ATP-binding protein